MRIVVKTVKDMAARIRGLKKDVTLLKKAKAAKAKADSATKKANKAMTGRRKTSKRKATKKRK